MLQKRSETKDTFLGCGISSAGHIEFDPETQGTREKEGGRFEDDERKEDNDECVDEADKHSRHPNSSRNTACREVAEELGIRWPTRKNSSPTRSRARQNKRTRADVTPTKTFTSCTEIRAKTSRKAFQRWGRPRSVKSPGSVGTRCRATWHKEYFNTPRTHHQKSNSPLLYDDNASDERISGAKLVPRHELYVKTLDDMFKSVHVVSAGKIVALENEIENARDGRLLASPLKKKPPPPKKKT